MAKQGYIKLYRQIEETAIWADSDKLKLWLLCLMKASHDEQIQVIGNQTITLSPGQFTTGRFSIQEEFNKGVSKKKCVDGLTLFRWLNLFENLKMLNIKKTNKYSIVTIVNWHKYQTNEHQMNIKRTSNEHQMNTNKNDKECIKNVKNKTYIGIIQNYTDNEVLIEALKSYVDMRQKTKGFTTRALELNLNALNKLTNDIPTKIEIVNQSISNTWKSFYPLKNQKQSITQTFEQTEEKEMSDEELKEIMANINSLGGEI